MKRIDSLQMHMVECTSAKKGWVKYLSNTICLCAQRVYCKECKKTNALLPSLLVPCSQIPRQNQQEILHAMNNGSSPERVMERNTLIDENNIKYIFSQFKKHWEQRLPTVERFVRMIRREEGMAADKDMRRYERPHVNEVWYGDTCFGPWLATPEGKRRVYFIALIDDASRFMVAADIFFNDTFENLMTVIRCAVSKHGRPKLFSFDNGSVYRNLQMELLAARIGSSVHYCEPYTPTSKSKIERWFLTLRMQYLASLDMRNFHDLDELRRDFSSYVSRYNQAPHSSLAGQSPQERFFSEPEQIRRLTEDQIEKSFLLEIERRVSPDCVVVIDRVEYEVHYRYAKQRIRLRYSPDMEKVYVVEPSGELTPVRLLNKTDNAVVKRERVRLSGGGDPS